MQKMSMQQLREFIKTLPPDRLVLLPYYKDVENEIKQPDRVRIQTAYFWEKWVSLLGPVGALLIMKLRQYCYYNRETKELRDWCFPKQETLAKELGVSRHTILREFRENSHLSLFVKRTPQYRYDPQKKKKVRTTDVYHIRMDDPLMEEDQERLRERLTEKIATEGDGEIEKILNDQGKASNPQPKSQNATQVPQPLQTQAQPRSQNATQVSGRNLQQYDVLPLRDTFKTVNGIKKPSAKKGHDPLADELARELCDEKSIAFYIKVVSTMPEDLIHRALSEVKYERAAGKIREGKAKLFNSIVQRMASEAGIDLGLKTGPKKEEQQVEGGKLEGLLKRAKEYAATLKTEGISEGEIARDIKRMFGEEIFKLGWGGDAS